MSKKLEKTHEQKAVEDYLQADKEDIKYAIEKSVKEKSLEPLPKKIVEKTVKQTQEKTIVEKIADSPKNTYINKDIKKNNGKNEKATKRMPREMVTKSSTKKIVLKRTGYEIIITEKPQAALKIANALASKSPIQKEINKVPYYELERNGKEIIVACAVGHLFTLKQNSSSAQIPTFNISWIPNYLARKKDFTKRYYDALSKLIKNAGSLTIATDYDAEGEVIGMNIMRYICHQEDASRMKFSTLTKDELNKSYENKSNHIDWGQAIAGETRHYLDWFYGINLSRALMNSIKSTGKFKIMSIGRVQGPALNMIVQKEKEIQKFKPEKYWQTSIIIKDKLKEIELKHNKDISSKKELEKFKNLKGKKTKVETKELETQLPPQTPFNLTDLQIEAYKIYGITPKITLQIAQALYLAGLISYPRTSSQKLPPSVGYEKIIKELAKDFGAEELISRRTPIEGKKTDPAHPSIYPTGSKQILSGEEEKIYNLIVKRFLSLFCDNALIETKTIIATIENLKFEKRGQTVKNKAWLEIYPYKIKEEKIPKLSGEYEIFNVNTEEKETHPPKRYSQASIISALEKKNLGTKATRASIIEILYDRGYIKGQTIKATPLGISLIGTLKKYSPVITDENLTRKFEKSMEKIQEKKNKAEIEKEEKNIIEEAKRIITGISIDFEKNNEKIGKELINANLRFREQQKIENRMVPCPKCKEGNLAINYSKKNKRFFVACDAYPKCKNTYSLPPNGVIKRLSPEKLCESCNFPQLIRLSKGKKPWIFCWNPECETNKSWAGKFQSKNTSN